jgi:hypothetical protein
MGLVLARKAPNKTTLAQNRYGIGLLIVYAFNIFNISQLRAVCCRTVLELRVSAY